MTPEQARHLITNLLSRYCAAVDEHDSVAVAELLASTTLTFRGTVVVGRDQIADFYAAAFADPALTRHVFHNLRVEPAEELGMVRYRAGYQRWTLDPDPRCTALGGYEGTVEHDRGSWRWITHDVATLTSPPRMAATNPYEEPT